MPSVFETTYEEGENGLSVSATAHTSTEHGGEGNIDIQRSFYCGVSQRKSQHANPPVVPPIAPSISYLEFTATIKDKPQVVSLCTGTWPA